jgi:protein ImuA
MIHPLPHQTLRNRIARLAGSGRLAASPSLSFAVPEIDAALPWRGLARGALHEAIGEPSAIAGFLTALIGRDSRSEQVLWIGATARLYAQGLIQLGLNHHRLTVVSTPRAADRLWAFEEGLRELRYGAMIAEIDSADLTETRRLQLAAEKCGSIGFLVRKDRQPSAALTRWRIMSAPSDGYRPCWRIGLERCRGAEAGFSWAVEWNYATFSFRLVAALADGSVAAAE